MIQEKGKTIYPIRPSHPTQVELYEISQHFGLEYWLEGPHQMATYSNGEEADTFFNELLKQVGLK